MARFAALTFVGPGEIEAKRLKRLLESLLIHEHTVQAIVIIDDKSGHCFDNIIPPEFLDRTIILPNPRRGRGDWWQGGLCVGLAEGFQWIGKNLDVEFVVRLDTDALVINSFADRIIGAFDADSRIGLLGTWDKYSFNGKQRLPKKEVSEVLSYTIKKASKHLAVWRHSNWPTRIQCSLFKNDRIVRKIICSAIQNGYQPGDFLQGGAYAIRGQLIRELYVHRLTTTPLAFLHQFFGEDVLATLLCYSMAYYPRGFNQKGEVFGVQNQGLPATIPQLVNARFAIVHSVKEL
jgi:hypothetical protein